LTFRLSLDFKEINQLHADLLLLWAGALRVRGAPLAAGADIAEMIDEYFFDDALHNEDSLRFEAKLLVDMLNVLKEWDKINEQRCNSKPNVNITELDSKDLKVSGEIITHINTLTSCIKISCTSNVQLPANRIWTLLLLSEGLGSNAVFKACLRKLYGILRINDDEPDNIDSFDILNLSIFGNHLTAIVHECREYFCKFFECPKPVANPFVSPVSVSQMPQSLSSSKLQRFKHIIKDVVDDNCTDLDDVPIQCMVKEFVSTKSPPVARQLFVDTKMDEPQVVSGCKSIVISKELTHTPTVLPVCNGDQTSKLDTNERDKISPVLSRQDRASRPKTASETGLRSLCRSLNNTDPNAGAELRAIKNMDTLSKSLEESADTA